MKVVAVTVEREDGTRTTWRGRGEVKVISTQTKADDRPPAKWPTLTYVDVHLLLKDVERREPTVRGKE